MLTVDQREQIRRAYFIEGKSIRRIAREGLHDLTLGFIHGIALYPKAMTSVLVLPSASSDWILCVMPVLVMRHSHVE